MKKNVLFIIPLFFVYFQLNAQWTVNTVPNPMTQNKTFVSNPDKILSAEQVNLLDSIIKGIERQTSAEIAIVMLQSIGNETPKTFANTLFNLWKVGKKESDNGLLVLFVMDQRRIEFETGYGMEIALTDAMCYQIQQDNMVPRFKEGDYGKGIINGMLAVATILTNMQFEISETGTSISTSSLSKEYTAANTNSSSTTSNDYSNYTNDYSNDYNYDDYESPLGIYLRIVLIAMFLYLLLYIITIFQNDYFKRYQTLRIFKLYFWFILFPIPFILIFIYTKRLLESWRNTPRISAKTGKRMRKLNEEQDDKYLKSGQISEEHVKSIDYDVWVTDEEDDILILAYKRWFSKYSGCPKCKYKTYYKEYDRVISAATYSSSGTGEKKYKCVNCGHYKISRYTIPKKTKSSSSSSSGSSFGGSSSFGGGSSSFGGGSSGGGGAGSSW